MPSVPKPERTPLLAFTVYGEPVAQGRPKFAAVAGHGRAYDPKKSRDYKSLVRQVAQEHVPAQLLTGPLILVVKVYRPIPKSFSKRKREAAAAGLLRPTTRPDLRNHICGVEDALTKLVWTDDSQVVGYGDTGKWFGDPPRIEVEVHSAEEICGAAYPATPTTEYCCPQCNFVADTADEVRTHIATHRKRAERGRE